MSTGTLHWYQDRGFVLDVEAAEEDVALRLDAVPVPADGTLELRAGVKLDRLDILFKASIEIQGEPAQLHEARIQLVTDGGRFVLEIDAQCEDVETGDIVPLRLTVPIEVPSGAPEKDGPRPVPTDEDDLDWEDDNTLEQLVVNAPETPNSEDREVSPRRGARLSDTPEPAPSRVATPEPARGSTPKGGSRAKASAPPSDKGFHALLEALSRLDDDEPDEPSAEVERPQPARAKTPAPARRDETNVPRSGGDQLLGEEGEAKGLLDILVNGDHLELEGDAEVESLVPGVAKILSLSLPSDAKATRLSTWLLDQEEVADLFIDDDDLAEILERW